MQTAAAATAAAAAALEHHRGALGCMCTYMRSARLAIGCIDVTYFRFVFVAVCFCLCFVSFD